MMLVHTYLTITQLITEGEVKDLKHLSQQVNKKTASFALQMLRPTDKVVLNQTITVEMSTLKSSTAIHV